MSETENKSTDQQVEPQDQPTEGATPDNKLNDQQGEPKDPPRANEAPENEAVALPGVPAVPPDIAGIAQSTLDAAQSPNLPGSVDLQPSAPSAEDLVRNAESAGTPIGEVEQALADKLAAEDKHDNPNTDPSIIAFRAKQRAASLIAEAQADIRRAEDRLRSLLPDIAPAAEGLNAAGIAKDGSIALRPDQIPFFAKVQPVGPGMTAFKRDHIGTQLGDEPGVKMHFSKAIDIQQPDGSVLYIEKGDNIVPARISRDEYFLNYGYIVTTPKPHDIQPIQQGSAEDWRKQNPGAK